MDKKQRKSKAEEYLQEACEILGEGSLPTQVQVVAVALSLSIIDLIEAIKQK